MRGDHILKALVTSSPFSLVVRRVINASAYSGNQQPELMPIWTGYLYLWGTFIHIT